MVSGRSTEVTKKLAQSQKLAALAIVLFVLINANPHPMVRETGAGSPASSRRNAQESRASPQAVRLPFAAPGTML